MLLVQRPSRLNKLDSLSRWWQTFNELTNPKAVVGCLGLNVFDTGAVLQRTVDLSLRRTSPCSERLFAVVWPCL